MIDTEIIYAIGDIHGRSDLLSVLLTEIETHAADRPSRIIFLGDYIDRGPDSAGVIRTVRDLAASRPGLVHCLMGNHEQMLLLAREDQAARACWLDNGGRSTLDSFKAGGPEQLPDDVVGWMRGLPTFYEDAQHYFVHAGVDPSSSLGEQTDADRLWMREPFISADHDFGKHVVHGHTPVRNVIGASPPIPDEREHRTNVDTGAVFGGALTAAVFDDRHMHPIGFLQVQQDGDAQFLSSRRQVLELMTRLAGQNVAVPVSVAGRQDATYHSSSRRIAASVLILGLAGTGLALASMNWTVTRDGAGTSQSNAKFDVAVSGSGTDKQATARASVAARAPPRASNPAPDQHETVPALPPQPPLIQAEPKPQAPKATPQIAQDQVTSQPANVPEPALADADQQPAPPQSEPPLPQIAQDQTATQRESVTDTAITDANALPQKAPVVPQIAQDQRSTQAEGESQLAGVTSPSPSSQPAADPKPSAVATVSPPLQATAQPDAMSAQPTHDTGAAELAPDLTAGQLAPASQQQARALDIAPNIAQQGESAPVVDEHAIARELAGLLDQVPQVDDLAGLQPPVNITERTTPATLAGPHEDTTRTAPTQASPDTDAITRKLADLTRQVPQPESLLELSSVGPPPNWNESVLAGGPGTPPTVSVEADPAEQKLVARQNAIPVVESLSKPAKGNDADPAEGSGPDTGLRVVASIPPASPGAQASRQSSPAASPVAADPTPQKTPMPLPRPAKLVARPANTPANSVSTNSIRPADPDRSGLSRQFAPLRLATRGEPHATDRGDPADFDRQRPIASSLVNNPGTGRGSGPGLYSVGSVGPNPSAPRGAGRAAACCPGSPARHQPRRVPRDTRSCKARRPGHPGHLRSADYGIHCDTATEQQCGLLLPFVRQ